MRGGKGLRAVLCAAVLAWLLCAGAKAEEAEKLAAGVDLSVWQAELDGAQSGMEAGEMLRALVRGEGEETARVLTEKARQAVLDEIGLLGRLMLKLMAPALLCAAARQLSGQSQAAGLVCYLTGAGMMISEFAGALRLTQEAAGRIGGMTEGLLPVMTALLTATGRTETAGLIQSMISLCGGVLTAFVERVTTVLGGGAAVLAAAGNLTERMPLKGLFKLCISAGNWLLSGVMMLFAGLCALSGGLGGARDGLSMRAAKYAAGSLLPVVGGDVAGTMDAMAYSAGLVRQAAGVTGVAAMLGVCLRPLVRLGAMMLAHMTAAALSEPAADGALCRCMEQMGQSIRLLLVGTIVNAVLFILLIGLCLSGINGMP